MNGAVKLRYELLEKALALLTEVPLCDRCLGRMFALLGRGFSNKERGRALKTVLVQLIHDLIREGNENARALFMRIAPNIGETSLQLYRELFGKEYDVPACYVCGSKIEHAIRELGRLAVKELRNYNIRSFIVAAHIAREVIEAENELKLRFRLAHAESIGAELRREVSKYIQSAKGLKPNFENPDAVIDIYYPDLRVTINPLPVLLKAKYKKLARRISQSTWIMYDGRLKYPYSVELAARPLLDLYKGERIVLHAAGREDADARMLGTGRPCILEIKRPKQRHIEIGKVANIIQRETHLVSFNILGSVKRKDVAELKKSDHIYQKVYRVLVVSSEEVNSELLSRLETFFSGKVIKQRTPRRVRHRRPDLVRHRTVYAVRTKLITPRIFEALILAEAGLYIKELIDGDGGDTIPNFADYLGQRLYCAELDVCMVRTYLPHSGKEG